MTGMARTLDEIVQDTLGAQTMTILRLQAEVESLRAKVAALEPPPPAPTKES
jgi:hypothetical protein